MSAYVLEREFERGEGAVHSVFAHSFNVCVDGFLIHVGGAGEPLSCIGCCVPARLMEALLAQVEVGDRVRLERGVLAVFGRRGAVHVDAGALAPRSLALRPPVSEARLEPLRPKLERMGVRNLIGLAWDDRLHEAVSMLGRLDASEGAYGRAMEFLIGRGPGLTPSGDDILMGCGIALQLRGRAQRFVGALQKRLKSQTTDVSAAYLRAMMAGHASQGYCELAQAARAGTADCCDGVLRDLQAVGHTSGNDGLFGFSVGLGAL